MGLESFNKTETDSDGDENKIDSLGRETTTNFVSETILQNILDELKEIKLYMKSIAED